MKIMVGSVELDLVPVSFDSVKAGDVVAHYVDDGDERHLWVGVAEDYAPRGESWFGRVRGSVGTREFSDQAPILGELQVARIDTPDLTILSKWHETEPGHSIYLVRNPHLLPF